MAPPGGVLNKTTLSTTVSSTLVPKAPPQSLPNGTQKSSETQKNKTPKTSSKNTLEIPPPQSSPMVANGDHVGVFFDTKRYSEPERGIFTKHQYSGGKPYTSVRGRSPKDLKKPPRGRLLSQTGKNYGKVCQKPPKRVPKGANMEAKTSKRATQNQHRKLRVF